MRRSILLLAIGIIIVLRPACVFAKSEMAEGIVLEIVGGKADVEDWVAEVTLDLNSARTLLAWSGASTQISVFELNGVGTPAKQVASQVDITVEEDLYVVSWRVTGKLDAGQKRRFLLRFGALDELGKSEHAIHVATSSKKTIVTNGDITLVHDRDIGGMIRQVTVSGASGKLSWGDKVFDGSAYYLAKGSAEKMTVSAKGPLRAVIEVENSYVKTSDGENPPSRPRATYRFTNYAGLPFTVVEATVSQQYAHQWSSLHFIEIGIGDSNFTHFATDGGASVLKRAGTFRSGAQWAAAYNDELLIASCTGSQPGVWDAGGKVDALGDSSYLRSDVSHMAALDHGSRDVIFWGPGSQSLEDEVVQRWNNIFSSPPVVRIYFGKLAKQLEEAEELLTTRQRLLAQAGLLQQAWAVEHVKLTLAGHKVAEAREKLTVGRFSEVLVAVESCQKILNTGHGEVELSQAGSVLAGFVLGHPYLSNDKVAYLWAKPEDGAGLVSIFDRKTSRELLRVDPASSTLWQVTVKKEQGGATFTNTASSCQVICSIDETGGRLAFQWSEDIAVEVGMRLGTEEGLLRGRINRIATPSDSSGIVAVTFPVVKGIMPMTPGARRDVILDTGRLGDKGSSPLTTGKVKSNESTPAMQFAALIGDGMGLYFGEEDGQANRKQLTWTANASATSLSFSITHPILGWGGDHLAQEYQSPGDIVLGVFHGNWYDAARIYRKWAITAPWCSKGPIHERADYPRWFAKAPYWVIASLGDEGGIEKQIKEHEFFDVPTMVAHVYQYWFAPHQDDRYPDSWPPRLGSQGLKEAVKRLQAKGIRIVPYLNGKIWDMDTDSYRMKDAERKGAYWISSNGDISVTSNYGGGQAMVTMCPGSDFWRKRMQEEVTELFGRYGVDGVYFDFLTDHVGDCYNKAHGHPICGGNFWSKAVHDFYAEARAVAKKLNPEAMMAGEGVGEYCIDVHDSFLCSQTTGTKAPLFQAVYHGYANIYGGVYGKTSPLYVGRWWLMGAQNGWHGGFLAPGPYYRDLLKCRWLFGTPYLGYGEMLRPPQIEGDLAKVTGVSSNEEFTVPVVEGSAWKAPDGTIGLFFLNYDEKKPYDFTWTVDLAETGIGNSKNIKISRWGEESGLSHLKNAKGGKLTETMEIAPLEIIALKLEVMP